MCCHGLIAFHLGFSFMRFVIIGAMVVAFIVVLKVLGGILFLLKRGTFGSRHGRAFGCAMRHEPPRPASRPFGFNRPEAPRASTPRFDPPRRERSGMPAWPLLTVALLFFGLVAIGFRLKEVGADAARQPPAAAESTAQPASDSKWEVTGYGEKEADARQTALENAQEKFLQYLATRTPPLQWQPAPDYLQNHLKKEWTVIPAQELEGGLGKAAGVKLLVQVTPKDRQEIAMFDHQVRRENRMFFLSQILAALVAVLTAVAGYVRLDEWSKGYYTGWLRLAAAGFLSVIAAAAWIFIHPV